MRGVKQVGTDLQAMIRIHEQWSEYAALLYNVTNCAFIREEYWAN